MVEKIGLHIHIADLLFKRACDACPEICQSKELTGTHGHILAYLREHEGQIICQRDIESAFRIRRSTASQILQLMERNGLIERQSVSSDARLRCIITTTKGKQIDQNIRLAFARVDKKALQGLSQQQIEVFLSTLETIKQNLGACHPKIN